MTQKGTRILKQAPGRKLRRRVQCYKKKLNLLTLRSQYFNNKMSLFVFPLSYLAIYVSHRFQLDGIAIFCLFVKTTYVCDVSNQV